MVLLPGLAHLAIRPPSISQRDPQNNGQTNVLLYARPEREQEVASSFTPPLVLLCILLTQRLYQP